MIKKYASIKPIFLDNTTDTLLTPKLKSTSDDDIKALAIQTAFLIWNMIADSVP